MFAGAVLIGAPVQAQQVLQKIAPKAEDVFGLWENGGARVDISRCGEGACLKIARIAGGPSQQRRLDIKNPDLAKHTELVLGKMIMTDAARYGADGFFGKVYNPDDGRTYTGKIRSRGPNTLHMAGCVLSVICRTLVWTRVRTP